MKILVTGSSGYIGSRLVRALREAGHEVLELVRRPRPEARWQVQGDFRRDHRPDAWRSRLEGVDIVVNAVGILRESPGQSFSALHSQAPRALFAACMEAGVRKVIQISALGADADAVSRYHVSKANADRYLMDLPLAWIVLRPSLVFGAGGASTRFFCSLATLPVVPLLGTGEQRVQPVHIDDLVALCVRLVASDAYDRQVIDVAGPAVLTMRESMTQLRAMLGLGRPRFLRVPRACALAGASVVHWWPGALLDRETLAMLERGSTADTGRFAQALDRPPRPAIPFADAQRWRAPLLAWARESWTAPVMRASLAVVWIVTGLLSLGIFPVEQSLALLARTGLTGATAKFALYGAAGLDILLGLGVLFMRRRWLWRAQLALIVGYSVVIAVALPEFWLHPFGPVLKNVALLAMILVLHETERR